MRYFSLLVLIACSSKVAPIGGACTKTNECTKGTFCLAGKCDSVQCLTNADCGTSDVRVSNSKHLFAKAPGRTQRCDCLGGCPRVRRITNFPLTLGQNSARSRIMRTPPREPRTANRD